MGVTELVLVRHGESTGNVAWEQAELSGAEVISVECRDADVPLTETGRAQAEAVGRWLAAQPVDTAPNAAWCSPYVRARETARVALDGWGAGVGLHLDERLRDKELGIVDTLTVAGILARFPAEAQRRRWLGKFYYRAPGGESWADLVLRIRSTLMDLDRVEDGRRVLVFTHDAMVLLFRYVCEDMDEQTVLEMGRNIVIGNASITRLVRTDAGWKVADFNGQDHLLFDGRDLRTQHGSGRPEPREGVPVEAAPMPSSAESSPGA